MDGAKGRKILVDPRHFRTILGSYPTGVSVITSVSKDGERWGLAVGTFTAISLDPPLVGFMPDKRSMSWKQIEKTGAFCVNILSAAQLDMCRRFAVRGGDKFDGISHGHSPGGLPLLDGVLAWVECGIEKVVELGDHVLVVGAVRALEKVSDETPLLFHRGGYHTLNSLD
jgi:3-hydroxy-9,10-secoandrosta-1,3,5(10)-triene-9,17-dione monooxygenase reductase component